MNNTEYNLYPKFDIEQHKKHYVHYLEVVISPEGEVEYAVPSHQEKLIAIACKQKSCSRQELYAICPKEYYFDFLIWLCKITGYISVWETFTVYTEDITTEQVITLRRLSEAGLYLGQV